MAIDAENFKDDLAKAFVFLLESKRGTASKLAKAVGKPPSFVNEVKRGKPVNSIHLKAVGVVFGAEKVLELLSLKDVHSDNSNITVIEHQGLIKRFKNPEKGLKNNEHLINIENASEKLYQKVSDYLEIMDETADVIREEKQKKKSSFSKNQASGD